MEREFKFQSALEGTKVPHAKAISLCTDISVTGSFFYEMEWVDGMVPNDPIPNEGFSLSNKKILDKGFKFLYALDESIKEMIGKWSKQNLIKDLEHV